MIDISNLDLEGAEDKIKEIQQDEIKSPEAVEPKAPTTEEAGAFEDIMQAPTPEAPLKENTKQAEEIGEKTEEIEDPEELKRLAERNAKNIVNLTDLLVSRACSLISGEKPSRYKLEKVEKEEYIETAAAYFETIKTKISPATVFVMSTITIFSSILFRAFQDWKTNKKAKEQEQKLKEASERGSLQRAAAKVVQMEPKSESMQVDEIKIPEVKKPKIYFEEVPEARAERGNFEIYLPTDKPKKGNRWKDELLGMYKRSKDNDRYTYEEALKKGSRPSPIVKNMIDQRLLEAQFKKKDGSIDWPLINKDIRNILREFPKMNE